MTVSFRTFCILTLYCSVAMARELGVTKDQQKFSCSGGRGEYRVEVMYDGDPHDFNIAITALGIFADAPDSYFLDLGENETDGQLVTRQGCFLPNVLHKFVIYNANTMELIQPSIRSFALFVNDREIVSQSGPPTDEFEEFFFFGDSMNCVGEDAARFTFDVAFDDFPEEVNWQLENVRSGEVILAREDTLKAGTERYSADFRSNLLFVDRCMTRGGYSFNFEDCDGSIDLEPEDEGGYFTIAINGSEIETAGFAEFFFNGTSATVIFTFNPNIGCLAPSSFSNGEKSVMPGTPVSFPREPPAPTPIGSISGFGCFSGSTTVFVKDRGTVPMRNLQLSDQVRVSDGMFEPVYSFGHYDPEGQSYDFVEISTSNHVTIQVSRHHLIFVRAKTSLIAVPANSIHIGDHLIFDDMAATVIEINKSVHVEKGLYAPFTPSGRLLVNGGFLVSAYIGFDESSASLSVGGIQISQQWAAQSFEVPHRVWCHHLGSCASESYDEDGLSTWVSGPMRVAMWVRSLPFFARNVSFTFFLLGLLTFNLIEMVVFRYPVVGILGLMLVRRLHSSPKTTFLSKRKPTKGLFFASGCC